MSWKLLKTLSTVTKNYCPSVGRVWMPTLFFFRVALILTIGIMVFGDEQTSFVCRDNKPGCELACFNDYTPISHLKLWALQIFCVGTPTILFIIYSALKISKLNFLKGRDKPSQRTRDSGNAVPVTDSVSNYSETQRNGRSAEANSAENRAETFSERQQVSEHTNTQSSGQISNTVYDYNESERQISVNGFGCAYLIQVVTRILVESGFLSLQYNLYKWKIPARHQCTALPCIYKVECYISQPMEKTVFLWIMYFTTLLSLFLSFSEIVRVFHKAMRSSSRRCFSNSWTLMSNDDVVMEGLTTT